MDNEQTPSGAEAPVVQEPASEAATEAPPAESQVAVQEPASEAAEQAVQEGDAEEPDAAARAEQSERDRDNHLKELDQRLRAAERRAAQAEAKNRAAEQQVLQQQNAAERAYWMRKRDSENPEEREEFLDWMREQEKVQQYQGSGVEEGFRQMVGRTLSTPFFAQLGTEEREIIADEFFKYADKEAAEGRWSAVRPDGSALITGADLVGAYAEAIAQRQFGNKVAELESQVKTLREEKTALENQVAGANLDGSGGGPPRTPSGSGISTDEERRLLLDDATPIDRVQEIRARQRAAS